MELPKEGLLKLREIVNYRHKNKKTGEVTESRGIIPISKSTWWQGINDGKYPQPVRMPGGTFWRVEDIRNLLKAG